MKKFSYGDQSIWCLHDASQYMDVNDAEQLLQDGQCLNVADKSDRQANKDIEQLSKSLFRQKGRLQLHLSYLLNCDNQKDKPVSAFYHSNVCQVFDAMLGPLKKWFIDDSEDGFRHLDISYEGAKLFVNGEIISLDALLGRGEYAEKDKMALDELEIDDSEHHDERADDIPAQYRD